MLRKLAAHVLLEARETNSLPGYIIACAALEGLKQKPDKQFHKQKKQYIKPGMLLHTSKKLDVK